MEYLDEGSASVAKDALHNYKLDGENKIKVGISSLLLVQRADLSLNYYLDYVRQEVTSALSWNPLSFFVSYLYLVYC